MTKCIEKFEQNYGLNGYLVAAMKEYSASLGFRYRPLPQEIPSHLISNN